MKTLVDIYQTYKLPENGISDKGTTHSYIEEYERLFAPYRARQPITMLEIGLCRGGSLRMWHEYFEKSDIYGVDITDTPSDVPDLKKLMAERLPRMDISIFDARSPALAMWYLRNAKFDIIIEDGSHNVEDSIIIYTNLIHRLKPGGLYIIEDVENIDSSRPAFSAYILKSNRQMEVLDLRAKKNRFDDVLVVVR